MLPRVLPTATTDGSLRIISAEPGFRDALVRYAGLILRPGDSLVPAIAPYSGTHCDNADHYSGAGEDVQDAPELHELLRQGRTFSVTVRGSFAQLVVSPGGPSERHVVLVADGPHIIPHRDNCDDSEAQMATLASRLQAVPASAVELSSSIHDTEMIYRTAFENMSAAVPFDTGSIQILHDNELEIVSCAGFSHQSSVIGLQFPLDDRFPNYYVITGKTPLALDDIRVDFPHFLSSEGEFGSGHIRSWMGVPLLDRGEVIGMLTMDRATVCPFGPDEIELAQALANHAAVALSNARMYESLQRANELQYMLLRELHHRVKNNLQLVSSLLNLRALDVDEGATRLIDELRTHIQALAASHDNIFQPGLSEDVLLQPYVDDIARAIEAGYIPSDGSIAIVRDIPESARCGMDVAVPLGLITSELILNAVKHAFPGNAGGVITVTVTIEAEHLTLTVTDDGVGFPADPAKHRGFGLTLISTLGQQVDAELDRDSSPGDGTRWTVTVLQKQAVSW
ncbi:MAG: GAF domain-containing protein [Alkalispirochaeta sp.]